MIGIHLQPKCLLALVILFAAQVAIAETVRPNFVFLLVDDLGWGDFGCYGAEFYETPNIDQLARQGMRFDQGYAACTVCSPSRAAILAGCYPARLHLTDWIAGHKKPWAKLAVPNWTMKIEHQRMLLPEALKEAGYDTIFIGKWHLMPIGMPDFAQHYPTDHGFDVNIAGREWGQPKGPGRYFSPFGMPNLDDGKPGDFLTDKLTDAAIEFLNSRDKSKPFLLYMSYYTLHSPLMAPEILIDKYSDKQKDFDNRKHEFLDPRRAGMVECLDVSIGRILDRLEQLGLADNTVVILTGDNGGDHDETTGGLRDYKAFSHEGGVRVPLVVRWPGKSKPDSVCHVPVIGTDFYPTLLEMAGLPLRPDEHKDGVSLAPLLSGQSKQLERDKLFWHYPHYHRTDPYGAIRSGDWKLIEFYEDGRLELFNLANDPCETQDLAKQQPQLAQELLKELQAWRGSVDAQMMTPNPNFDPKRARKGPARKKQPKQQKSKPR